LPKAVNGQGMTSEVFGALMIYFYTGSLVELEKLLPLHTQRLLHLLDYYGFTHSDEITVLHKDLLKLVDRHAGRPVSGPN